MRNRNRCLVAHRYIASFPTSGVNLLKLHGSVKWWWEALRTELPAGLHYRSISEVSDDKIGDIINNWRHSPHRGPQLGVVFGGHNKLTAEGPFLDILSKTREELDRHSHLVVIGYS